jgi:hypothetical protein
LNDKNPQPRVRIPQAKTNKPKKIIRCQNKIKLTLKIFIQKTKFLLVIAVGILLSAFIYKTGSDHIISNSINKSKPIKRNDKKILANT